MVKFYLDRKTDKESQIFLTLYHRGKRLKVYTGKKISPSKWDIDACRANPRKYKTNPVGFNQFLQGLSDEVVKLVNENKPISKADIKAIVDKANGRFGVDSFFGFAEGYIEQQIAKGAMKPASAKSYRVTLNHLKRVNRNLEFDDVDLDFYDHFVSHLRSNGILATNTIGGHIKRLKWFMAAALDRDLHSNIAFKKKAFKATREETDQIYLTGKEIRQLASKAMPERLKRVADAFVLNCYLGIRFSDLAQIQKQNFRKDGPLFHLTMIQAKTNERVTIPVPAEAMPLLRRYDFQCPIIGKAGRLMSVQKFNEYLKEAAEIAELATEDTIRVNGQVKNLPKYSLIKSHTARRSFSTNLYLEGVPIQDIMAITGHRKEETFLLYVRADQLTKSKGLARHYTSKSVRSSNTKQKKELKEKIVENDSGRI